MSSPTTRVWFSQITFLSYLAMPTWSSKHKPAPQRCISVVVNGIYYSVNERARAYQRNRNPPHEILGRMIMTPHNSAFPLFIKEEIPHTFSHYFSSYKDIDRTLPVMNNALHSARRRRARNCCSTWTPPRRLMPPWLHLSLAPRLHAKLRNRFTENRQNTEDCKFTKYRFRYIEPSTEYRDILKYRIPYPIFEHLSIRLKN